MEAIDNRAAETGKRSIGALNTKVVRKRSNILGIKCSFCDTNAPRKKHKGQPIDAVKETRRSVQPELNRGGPLAQSVCNRELLFATL